MRGLRSFLLHRSLREGAHSPDVAAPALPARKPRSHVVYSAVFHRQQPEDEAAGFGLDLQQCDDDSAFHLTVAQPLSSSPFAVAVPMGGTIVAGDVLIAVQGMPVFETGAFDIADVEEMLRLAALRATATCTFARPRSGVARARRGSAALFEAEWREQLTLDNATTETYAGVVPESALHACLLFLHLARCALPRDEVSLFYFSCYNMSEYFTNLILLLNDHYFFAGSPDLVR